MDSLKNIAGMYIVRDHTAENVIRERFSESDIDERFVGFYEYLSNSKEFAFCSYLYKPTQISENKNEGAACSTTSDGAKIYSLIYVNEQFPNIFRLTCNEGRLFSQKDYLDGGKTELIPVVMGYSYQSDYKLGDTINGEYVIIGFLSKGNFYLAPGKTNNVLYLDDAIIAPLRASIVTSFSNADSVITSGTIITHQKKNLEQIRQVAISMRIYDDMEFISYSDQLSNIIRDTMSEVLLLICGFAMVLVLCIICAITTILNNIDMRQHELTIHLLCGACVKDIICRMDLQILIMISIPIAIAILFTKNVVGSISIFLTGFLVFIIVTAFPIWKLRQSGIPRMLRSD